MASITFPVEVTGTHEVIANPDDPDASTPEIPYETSLWLMKAMAASNIENRGEESPSSIDNLKVAFKEEGVDWRGE